MGVEGFSNIGDIAETPSPHLKRFLLQQLQTETWLLKLQVCGLSQAARQALEQLLRGSFCLEARQSSQVPETSTNYAIWKPLVQLLSSAMCLRRSILWSRRLDMPIAFMAVSTISSIMQAFACKAQSRS